MANVTEMKTREALLRLISKAVPRAVGTTVKRQSPFIGLGAIMFFGKFLVIKLIGTIIS